MRGPPPSSSKKWSKEGEKTPRRALYKQRRKKTDQLQLIKVLSNNSYKLWRKKQNKQASW